MNAISDLILIGIKVTTQTWVVGTGFWEANVLWNAIRNNGSVVSLSVKN